MDKEKQLPPIFCIFYYWTLAKYFSENTYFCVLRVRLGIRLLGQPW